MRSLTRPSTPRSSSRRISAASSIVHTCTCLPWRCADSTKRSVMRWRVDVRAAAPRPAPGAPRPGCGASSSATRARSAAGRVPGTPAAVTTRPRDSRRNSERWRCWKEPTHTRSWRPCSSTSVPQRAGGVARLEVDVDADAGEGLEDLAEQRHPVVLGSRAEPGPADLVPGQVTDPPGEVAHAVEPPVVEGDQAPVPRQVHVGLEVGVAEGDGAAEGGQGVLEADVRSVEGAAAVCEGHGGARQVGPRARHAAEAIRAAALPAVAGRRGARRPCARD